MCDCIYDLKTLYVPEMPTHVLSQRQCRSAQRGAYACMCEPCYHQNRISSLYLHILYGIYWVIELLLNINAIGVKASISVSHILHLRRNLLSHLFAVNLRDKIERQIHA